MMVSTGTDNQSFVGDMEVGTSTAKDKLDPVRIVVDDRDDATQTSTCICCSWTQMCEVLGNRQGTFIVALRPLRAIMIRAQQYLRTFRLELERGIKTKKSARETARIVKVLVMEMNRITTDLTYNIPPEEASMLRFVSYDLCELWRVIEAVTDITPEVPRVPSGRTLQDVGVVRKDSIGTEIRDMATGSSLAAVDEHSLKERITRNCETLEKLIKFIDKKTERRWWLRDVINFLQLFIKLALFISAAISVAYHKEQIAPIITLTIALIQGVVELLDQYFLQHTKPEEIKLSVMSTLTTLDSKV